MSVLKKSLDIRLFGKFSRDALKWSAVHVGVLAILLYDVSKKCKFADSKFVYLFPGIFLSQFNSISFPFQTLLDRICGNSDCRVQLSILPRTILVLQHHLGASGGH